MFIIKYQKLSKLSIGISKIVYDCHHYYGQVYADRFQTKVYMKKKVYVIWFVLIFYQFFMRYIHIVLTFTGYPCVCLETLNMVENIIITQTMEGHLYSYIKVHTTYIHIRTYHICTYVKGNITQICIQQFLPCMYVLVHTVFNYIDKEVPHTYVHMGI